MGGTAAQAWALANQQGAVHADGSPPPIGAPVFFTGGSSGFSCTSSKQCFTNNFLGNSGMFF